MTTKPTHRNRDAFYVLLLSGIGAALAIWIGISNPAGAQSPPSGWITEEIGGCIVHTKTVRLNNTSTRPVVITEPIGNGRHPGSCSAAIG